MPYTLFSFIFQVTVIKLTGNSFYLTHRTYKKNNLYSWKRININYYT